MAVPVAARSAVGPSGAAYVGRLSDGEQDGGGRVRRERRPGAAGGHSAERRTAGASRTSAEIGHSQRIWWGLSPMTPIGISTIETSAAATATAGQDADGHERSSAPPPPTTAMTAASTAATTQQPEQRRQAAGDVSLGQRPAAAGSSTTPVALMIVLNPDRPHHGGSATTDATKRRPEAESDALAVAAAAASRCAEVALAEELVDDAAGSRPRRRRCRLQTAARRERVARSASPSAPPTSPCGADHGDASRRSLPRRARRRTRS